MASIDLKNSPPISKKKRYIILGTLLGLGLFYLFKSFSLNHFSEDYYIIGQDTRWKELHLMNGKERNLVAFNNELLTSIAKQEDFRIRLTPSSNLIGELEKGNLQGILTSLQPDYSNENLLFSDPYFLIGPVLIVSSQPHIQNEKGKSIIGIPEDSPLLSSLEQDPSIHIKLYDNIILALADLREQRIDGAIFPAILAYSFTETFYKHELKIATLPLSDEGIRLVALKNEKGETLIKKFNAGLKTLKKEGSYHDMLQQWGLIDVEHVAP